MSQNKPNVTPPAQEAAGRQSGSGDASETITSETGDKPVEPQSLQESTLFARDLVDAAERKIQLEGKENPDEFMMPASNETLTQTRQRLEKRMAEEGAAQERVNKAAIMEQGSRILHLPEETKVGTNETGQILSVHAPAKEETKAE